MVELRLEDGTRLDLRGDEVIAITYAVNDIASIETRQGVTSNEFELPITDFNLKALGYPTNFNVNQKVNPFKRINAEIYEEELRIAKGFIQITNPSISGQVIPVTFFGENAEWFNLIKGKSIRDLNLSEYKHIFNPSTINASFSNTEGYKYALIDRNGLNFLTGDDLSCRNFTLTTYQSTIAKAIIKEAGFKINGTLLNDPLYKNTVIADTNDKFYALDEETERATSLGTVATTYPAGTNQEVIDFTETPLLNNRGDNYDAGVFTADTGYLANIAASLLVENIGTGTTTLTVELQVNGTTITSDVTSLPAGNKRPLTLIIGNVVLQDGVYYQLNQGDTVRVVISTDLEPVEIKDTTFDDTGAISLLYGSFGVNINNVAIEGSEINIEATLPDVDQADFVQEFVFDHNALVTVNLSTKEIRFDLKKYNVENSLDWSNIIDLSESVDINYTDLTSNYAQINDVRRKDNDDVFIVEYNNRTNIKFGNGQFTLQNDFLENRGNVFESLFSPVKTINSLDQNQALPYIIGEKISGTYEILKFGSETIEIDISSNIEDFLKLDPNTVWGLVTDSGDVTYNRAYSIKSIVKDVSAGRYLITVNFNFPQTKPGLLRLVTRDEEADPRKLIDAGNYLIDNMNDVFSSFNITSVLPSPEDTINVISMPYFYFWNPLLNKVTDENFLSLSYGDIKTPSLSVNLLNAYYEQTIRILKEGKILRASFRLNQVDLFNLDFNKLIYLNFYLNGQTVTGYFILNKIEEYTGNADSTVCELIKI